MTSAPTRAPAKAATSAGPRHPRLPERALRRGSGRSTPSGSLGRDVERGRRDRGGRGGHACSMQSTRRPVRATSSSSPSRVDTTRTPAGAWRAVAGDEHCLGGRPRERRRRRARCCRRRGSPRRVAPEPLERGAEDGRVGLGRAELGRMTTASSSSAQGGALEDVVQRDVPVRDHGQARAPGAQARERGGHLGIRPKADRRQQGVLDVGQRQRRCPNASCTTCGAAPAQVLGAQPSRAPRRDGRGSRPSRPASRCARPRTRPPRRGRPARASRCGHGVSSSMSVPRASSRTAEGIPSRAMTALIVAADSSSGRLVATAFTLLAALGLVAVVHRPMRGRVHKLPDALGGAEMSPMLTRACASCGASSRRRSS